MSTAILDANSIAKQGLTIKTLYPAKPHSVYQRRADRLAELADDSGLPEYFRLLEQLVTAQAVIAASTDAKHQHCFGPKPQVDLRQEQPLAQANFVWGNYWQAVLLELIGEMLPQVSPSLVTLLKDLAATDADTLQSYAKSLLCGHFSDVPAQYSLFIWAALSVYWSHWAVAVGETLASRGVAYKTLCPVCGSHPVASVIKDEPRSGLRYLHCSLCESEWHQIRAECTCCGENKGVFLWAETETKAAIRIESCDTCKGYTKMMFTDINPRLEAAVDDLASLVMDKHVVEQGYCATTVNPLLLAHEEETTS